MVAAGRRAVCTTTTRIFPPDAGVPLILLDGESDPVGAVRAALAAASRIVVALRLLPDVGKLEGLLPETVDALADALPEACFLVEAIAKRSQNMTWSVSVDGTRQKHRRIRRVSMDEFYKTVTGQDDAFHKMCKVLPSVIQKVVSDSEHISVPHDTVIEELQKIADEKNGSIALALYMLGFETYIGF